MSHFYDSVVLATEAIMLKSRGGVFLELLAGRDGHQAFVAGLVGAAAVHGAQHHGGLTLELGLLVGLSTELLAPADGVLEPAVRLGLVHGQVVGVACGA